ncbi:hypothetical protein JYT53_00605 [Cytophagaceae bacterium AH-315-L13]|nr:hypothetical protein [Cytophagaceae bacterium AH-315-L13]
MHTEQNLGWKAVYIVFVACFLFGTTQNVLAQDEEPKDKGLEKRVFVVPEFDPTKKNENSQQNRVKVKSMNPELLDDPWADKLEERDREIEEQAKKEEKEKEALEMISEMDEEEKTENKEEKRDKEDIQSEEYKKDYPNPKKMEKSTKRD